LYGTHAFYTVAHFGGLDYSCTVGTLDDSHSGRPIDLDCHIDEQTLSKWFSKIGI
jgi:hypothetical protein